ncbi:MAG: hypothetical protein ACLRFL_03230 [Clostridia bacterium]
MKTLLQELWEIRGEVDDAIINDNKDLLLNAKERMEQLEYDRYRMGSMTLNTIGTSYLELQKGDANKRNNFTKIRNNLDIIMYKYIYMQDVSVKFGKIESIAELIWVARAMVDDFIRKSRIAKNSNNHKNDNNYLLLIDSVEERIAHYFHGYGRWHDMLSHAEYLYLGDILQFVRKVRYEYYGDRQVEKGFDLVSQDY